MHCTAPRPAVLASGATVIIGLLCLMFAQMNSTSSLGPVGAAGIACALLVMMILLPALLVIVGRWIFWPFVPHFGDPSGPRAACGPGSVCASPDVPVPSGSSPTVILGALSLGILQLDANGLSNEESFTTDQPSITAEKAVAQPLPRRCRQPRRRC